MERKIENCKLQIANCKLFRTRSDGTGSRIRRDPQFAICNGFTLVEILVVVAIIGLLAGLILAAIGPVRRAARKAAVKAEMLQIVAALEDFKANGIGGGQYPPDGTNPSDTAMFLRSAFPNVTWGTGTGQIPMPTNITPDTALVFWLGGAQDASGAFQGFSRNPRNPFDAGQSRTTVSYDFGKATTVNRFQSKGALTGPTVGTGLTWNMYQFFPANNQTIANNSPYLYFKAVSGSYSTTPFAYNTTNTALKTLPYGDSNAANYFINPKTYQLLCPGIDGNYGQYTTSGAAGCPQYPAGTNYDMANGLDDMTNFTKNSTVGDDMN